MALFKSGNPALKENTFTGIEHAATDEEAMTLQGTVNKTGFLLFTLLIPALYTWQLFNSTHDMTTIMPLFLLGLIGGLVTGLVISFKKHLSPYLSVVYAACEGLVLGGLSALMEYRYPGLVVQALLLTVGIFAVLLFIYKLEIIKPSENFRLIVASATGGVAFYYVLSLGLGFFGIRAPLVNDNSIGGIIFSLVIVVIASMNLVVDFDFIEQGVANRVPKYMEWYGAFGLIVTLVWLYIELLRLLSKARSR
ncbi:MAG TPA: Bax inhibitor-1/YccA family protein [Bacteroidota bacterium]